MGDLVASELHCSEITTTLTHVLPQDGVIKKPVDGDRERARVARRYEQPVIFVAYDFPASGDVRRNNRPATSGCFQQRFRQTFSVGRKAYDCGLRQHSRHIITPAEEFDDPLGRPLPKSSKRDGGRIARIRLPCEREAHARSSTSHNPRSIHKFTNALVVKKPGRQNHEWVSKRLCCLPILVDIDTCTANQSDAISADNTPRYPRSHVVRILEYDASVWRVEKNAQRGQQRLPERASEKLTGHEHIAHPRDCVDYGGDSCEPCRNCPVKDGLECDMMYKVRPQRRIQASEARDCRQVGQGVSALTVQRDWYIMKASRLDCLAVWARWRGDVNIVPARRHSRRQWQTVTTKIPIVRDKVENTTGCHESHGDDIMRYDPMVTTRAPNVKYRATC